MTPEEYEARVEALIAEHERQQALDRKRGFMAFAVGTVGTLGGMMISTPDKKGEWGVVGGLAGALLGDWLGKMMYR